MRGDALLRALERRAAAGDLDPRAALAVRDRARPPLLPVLACDDLRGSGWGCVGDAGRRSACCSGVRCARARFSSNSISRGKSVRQVAQALGVIGPGSAKSARAMRGRS